MSYNQPNQEQLDTFIIDTVQPLRLELRQLLTELEATETACKRVNLDKRYNEEYNTLKRKTELLRGCIEALEGE